MSNKQLMLELSINVIIAICTTHDVQLLRQPGAIMHTQLKHSTKLNLGTCGPTQCAKEKPQQAEEKTH